MKIKRTIGIVLISAFLLIQFAQAGWTEEKKAPVTPYGDYCRNCSRYGFCPTMLTIHQTVKALEDYYGSKGYRAEIKKIRGRFVIADIYKNGKTVDKIIFDRKTGRIRSIF